MDSPEFSRLSSLRGESKSEDYIQPHYKESYRVAIDRLVSDGRDSYHKFLKEERIGSFLSDEELLFITLHAEQPVPQAHAEEINGPSDTKSSSGTYWPLHSDVDTPDLDLGWPNVIHENLQTHIDLLFHPPRQNSPTIKEVIRKHIQGARQVVAIVMDKFTDVDIFREIVDASVRGVVVYLLLDDFHLKSFLTMAENHEVKIPQLRNMRVRTVKGQDYLCRSGAKFHGEMEQKFLLVDCHTAIYGSYSFTWSFEKINLSMVQIITGHLVGMYDEEFRTLYARSTVPTQLVPLEGFCQNNGPHGQQILPAPHSTQKTEHRDMVRQSLDAVYRKTCERKSGLRDLEERHLEEEPNRLWPVTENEIGAQSQMSSLQCAEVMNILKRHSYAGEKQEGLLPQNFRPRGSQWNISREMGNGINNYPMDSYLQVPPMNRGQKMYIDNNQYILPMQHNVPMPENMSKSHMRTQRIESYLKNTDVPFGDSCDYLDQFEPMDKAAALMQGRTRSSFVLKSTIPEDMEPHAPHHYASMQWNPAAETRVNNEEFMMKRKSLQILDENCNNANYGPARNAYQHSYASLGRPKGGHMMTHPDILSDTWQKRHSVADPRSDTEYAHDYLGHMYGALASVPVNRSTAGIHAQSGRYVSNLYEDQRSISQYDVKNINGINGAGSPSWLEAPCRTVSAAALDLKGREMGSQPFPPRNPKNIKSLLNIPENKEETLGTMETLSLKSGGSTDTLTAEDEVKLSDRRGKVLRNIINPVRSSSEHESSDGCPNSSKTHSSAAPHRASFTKTTRQQKTSALDKDLKPGLDRSKSQGSHNHVYSRYETSLEKKYSLQGFGSLRSHDKTKSPPKGEAAAEHNLTQPTRGHHETKLERFFQRVGHFIHKNK